VASSWLVSLLLSVGQWAQLHPFWTLLLFAGPLVYGAVTIVGSFVLKKEWKP
jgi:hypothetical protein